MNHENPIAKIKTSSAILLLFGFWSLPVHAQKDSKEPLIIEDKLARQIQKYTTQDAGFLKTLYRFAQVNRIPVGVEWIKTPNAEPIELQVKNVTVADALDALVRTQPGYKLRLEGGVVHVYTEKLLANKRNLLNLNIASYSVKAKELPLANSYLALQVQSVLTPDKSKGGTMGHIVIGMGMRKKLWVDMKDSTVREVLNALIQAHGNAIWIATFPRNLRVGPRGYWEITFPYKGARIGNQGPAFWLMTPLLKQETRLFR